MKKRILAAALCLTLLSGCGARPPLDLPDAESDRAVIAYVPLDDRPDNVGRVEYLAESLGYVLNMPEEWMFKTLLDGQMEDYYAENGLETQSWTGQSGYPGLLYDWVLEQEASGCDRYLLSVDQLLYGGLVASRLAETTTERDGEPWPLTDLLESLLSALAEDPNNEVWLLDSVMRLAPTVGYAGGTLEYYNAMRTIGAAPRKTLTGDELTLENIRATYDTDADGHDLLRFEDSAMYDAALRYTEHRINKLTLSGELLETVSRIGGDRFHVLIGIDDSSSEDCIQKNEIAYLQARLRAGDVILSGVDDLAFKAVTKLYLNEVSWNGAGVNVQYFGGTEDRPACDYDYKPLTEIVAEHLGYFDLTVEDTPADLYVLVLTQPEDAAQKQQYIQELTATLNERLKADRLHTFGQCKVLQLITPHKGPSADYLHVFGEYDRLQLCTFLEHAHFDDFQISRQLDKLQIGALGENTRTHCCHSVGEFHADQTGFLKSHVLNFRQASREFHAL